MKVRKAVIAAAGLGTRVLPASKSMPKEMLPIVDKPAIQYIVEEAVRSGIEEILIITSRGKTTVEDHFDRSPELEAHLLSRGKQQVYDEMVAISSAARIYYVRQQQPLGTGHAILQAKAFVEDDPFVVMYGDDVIIGDDPACSQVCRVFESEGKCTVAMKEVTPEQVRAYCSLSVKHMRDNLYAVDDMIEKPQRDDQVFSLFSILGRCVLTPDVFEIIERMPAGVGGELQLTDAMAEIARTKGMCGVDFTGKRYDMGNKLGVLQAIAEVGVKHPEIGEAYKEYLKQFVATL